MSERQPGVWFTYEWDYGPYAMSVYETAERAAEAAARQGYGKVGYWPFGVELRDAVNTWEGRS